MPTGRLMTEHDLLEHIRKAVTPVETAPKQKHVRSNHIIHAIFISNYAPL
jgi:hypothetical protein